MSKIANIDIGGVAVPRLAFGLGSLMKWASGHTHPLPTDSSLEVQHAISAGFRHFNTGDLYTNNESAAKVLKRSGLKREELFFSLKLNTYAALGCKGRQSMIDSTKTEIARFGLNGYVDLLQLHFPPRGYPGNLSNREAWRVLEELKEQKVARIIGVSNWTVEDYADIFGAADLKHRPQINEYEFNPFLLFDPKFAALQKYESSHGVVSISEALQPTKTDDVLLISSTDYGVLTVVSGKLSGSNSSNVNGQLQQRSSETGLSAAELLLYWAYHRLGGILVTSTSKAERASSFITLLSTDGPVLPDEILEGIERAANADGYEGKVFYAHSHMDKAART